MTSVSPPVVSLHDIACPSCGHVSTSTCTRLVVDTCGHVKCRRCLLVEDNTCAQCLERHDPRQLQLHQLLPTSQRCSVIVSRPPAAATASEDETEGEDVEEVEQQLENISLLDDTDEEEASVVSDSGQDDAVDNVRLWVETHCHCVHEEQGRKIYLPCNRTVGAKLGFIEFESQFCGSSNRFRRSAGEWIL